MSSCLKSLLDYHQDKTGKNVKAVIWAHNSHIGDARASDRKTYTQEWNLGQLVREKLGEENTFHIGFSSYGGSVTAAHEWDTPPEFMKVRNGLIGSHEYLFHNWAKETGNEAFYMLTKPQNESEIPFLKSLKESRNERYIGVIYRPETEKASHYTVTNIQKEYDAIIFLDKTNALEPLDYHAKWTEAQELYQNYIHIDRDQFPEIDSSIKIKDEDWILKSAQELNVIGLDLLKEGFYDQACYKFNKAISYVRHIISTLEGRRLNAELYLNRARVYLEQENISGALKECKMAEKIDPKNPKIAEFESNVMKRMKNIESLLGKEETLFASRNLSK